jgi:hypothetical protein
MSTDLNVQVIIVADLAKAVYYQKCLGECPSLMHIALFPDHTYQIQIAGPKTTALLRDQFHSTSAPVLRIDFYVNTDKGKIPSKFSKSRLYPLDHEIVALPHDLLQQVFVRSHLQKTETTWVLGPKATCGAKHAPVRYAW